VCYILGGECGVLFGEVGSWRVATLGLWREVCYIGGEFGVLSEDGTKCTHVQTLQGGGGGGVLFTRG